MTVAKEGIDSAHAIGKRVRTVRQEQALTLRDLAALVDLSTATLSQLETGKANVSLERLLLLASALEVPPGRLLDPLGESESRGGSMGDRGGADFGQKELDSGDHTWRVYDVHNIDPVLSGALESFLAAGYHGSSVRDIARRCNLSVPGLYHYYPSKQAMLVAVFDATMFDLLGRSHAARAEGTDPVRRFSLMVECLALFHTYRRKLAFIGSSEMRSLNATDRSRIAMMRLEQQSLVDEEVLAAHDAGEFLTPYPREASRAVVTMCTNLASWYREDGRQSPESIAAQYVDFALGLVQSSRVNL